MGLTKHQLAGKQSAVTRKLNEAKLKLRARLGHLHRMLKAVPRKQAIRALKVAGLSAGAAALYIKCVHSKDGFEACRKKVVYARGMSSAAIRLSSSEIKRASKYLINNAAPALVRAKLLSAGALAMAQQKARASGKSVYSYLEKYWAKKEKSA